VTKLQDVIQNVSIVSWGVQNSVGLLLLLLQPSLLLLLLLLPLYLLEGLLLFRGRPITTYHLSWLPMWLAFLLLLLLHNSIGVLLLLLFLLLPL
jgi:hypothetical protein